MPTRNPQSTIGNRCPHYCRAQAPHKTAVSKNGRNMSCKITVLGGVGSIGMNAYLYETKTTAILVDAGIKFFDGRGIGVDGAIPDFTYLKSIKKKLEAIVITHAHEDHIGAIRYVLDIKNIPVYAPPLAIQFISKKLSKKPTFKEYNEFKRIKIGDFALEFIPVNHSILDTYAIYLKTGKFSALHSSDFKIDNNPNDHVQMDFKRISQIGKSGLTCLLSDSTNALVDGFSKSESSIYDNMRDIVAGHSGRVFVTTFASNISRLYMIAQICEETGRKLCIMGRSMLKNIDIVSKMGYPALKKSLLVTPQKALSMPDNKVCFLVTGCQGEQNASLYAVTFKGRKGLKIRKNDLVMFSSRVIPGNEGGINDVINQIYYVGASAVVDKNNNIHVSGHAAKEELKLLLAMTRPKYFLPIHGDYRHLNMHKSLATNGGYVSEKNCIILPCASQGEWDKSNNFVGINKVPWKNVYVDAHQRLTLYDKDLEERRLISSAGVLFISITMRKRMRKNQYTVDVVPVGFPIFMTDKSKIIDSVMAILEEHAPTDGTIMRNKDFVKNVKQAPNPHIPRRPLVEISIQKL